ncbi:SDR family NAD(P)-dependent oxidoreductase [Modestobacter versicolor]|uniref:NAD(P)-dependent dehydrogenase (Short-subunit alcohol dehydrogenase family) n=1 Tax=Modestobacter versicolor TaxID=429133 RepID=A0A323V887_9ACTN|nr:SDR family NAD(P)-dependent oxidoreductase [Modestobacter versicolor]MBB3674757.1 NAD(P)-dependent dehydrogenase (short-subunit alcohol dehydrogenase family) [Modestobacter versicolor]PZA19546.1 short-chain dehydrogenase/reductase [Modestobacter versicolor]
MGTAVKTWFITGTSTGFGRHWAEAALERGDRVVATARRAETIADYPERFGRDVLTLELDVTGREAVRAAVQRAQEHFGVLDVVVNNAGYGHFGMVEELTEQELRDQLETNFFGAVWVTQAALPVFRSQGHGHLVQVTSEGGVRAFPGIGAYHASKWAVEGLSESLWQEVGSMGIHVTNVEPGPYATDWLARGSRTSAPLPAYDAVRAAGEGGWQLGDPAATRAAMLQVVDSPEPPHRVFFGRSFSDVAAIYQDRLDTWREWEPVALEAFGSPQR